MGAMDDGGSTPARTLRWVLTGLVMIVVGLVVLFKDRGHDDIDGSDTAQQSPAG